MSIIALNKENFEKVINENEMVLVDFWAPWCMPCRMLGEVLNEVSQEMDNLVIGKVNVDENSELAQEFRVSSIPFVVLYKNGQMVKSFLGYRNKADLLKEILYYGL